VECTEVCCQRLFRPCAQHAAGFRTGPMAPHPATLNDRLQTASRAQRCRSGGRGREQRKWLSLACGMHTDAHRLLLIRRCTLQNYFRKQPPS